MSSSRVLIATESAAKVLPITLRKAVLAIPNRRSAIVITNAGTPGASGTGGDAHFVFTQGSPSTKWTIKHSLKKFPSVVVQDSANDEVEGDIEYLSNEELIVTFSSAFSGVAYLN
jgi:hypothetical protein